MKKIILTIILLLVLSSNVFAQSAPISNNYSRAQIDRFFATYVYVDSTSVYLQSLVTALSNSLGTASTKNTGISIGNVPVVGSNGKLDASILPNNSAVTSVNGQTGAVTLNKSDIGLGNVTNNAQMTTSHPANSITGYGTGSATTITRTDDNRFSTYNAYATDKADTDSVYTKIQINILLSSKADSLDLLGYYTKLQMDAILLGYASTTSVSLKLDASAITNYYTKTQIDNFLLLKADASNVYTKLQCDSAFATIASVNSKASKAYVDGTDEATLSSLNSAITKLNNVEKIATQISSSCLLSGGAISLVDSTHFKVGAGTGYIIDSYSDPSSPTYQFISWGTFENVTTPLLNTDFTTYITIETDRQLHFYSSSQLTPQERRIDIVIGYVDHPDMATITECKTQPFAGRAVASQLDDFLVSFGAFNIEGNVYSYYSGLQMSRTAGKTFDNNANWHVDPVSPHIVTTNAEAPVQIFYSYRDGSGGWNNDSPLVINADPNHWDNGSGILQDVPAGKYTIQPISYYAQYESNDFQYGQTLYDSMELAKSSVRTAVELNPYNTLADTFRGWMIVKQGTTDLSIITQAAFINAGKLGLSDIQSGSGYSGGEINTASNYGTRGYGVYDSKSGVDIRFKNIYPLSGRLSLNYNETTHTIDMDAVIGTTAGTLADGGIVTSNYNALSNNISTLELRLKNSDEVAINNIQIINTSQDAALNLAKITNDSQDVTINNINLKDISQDATIALKANTSDVNASDSVNLLKAQTRIGTFDFIGAATQQPLPKDKIQGCLVDGNILYMIDGANATYGGVSIYNIQNKANPIYISSFSMSTTQTNGVVSMSKKGNILYAGTSGGYLCPVDVTNPASPIVYTPVKQTGALAKMYNFQIVGNYVYCASQSIGFGVFDITNATTPVCLYSQGAVGNSVAGVAVKGNYAYVCRYIGGNSIVIWDISNPASPTVANTVACGAHPIHIKIVGNNAYIADTNSFKIFDLTNATNPVQLSSATTMSSPNVNGSLFVTQEPLIYVTTTYPSIEAWDCSVTTAPVRIGSLSGVSVLGTTMLGCDVSEGYIYTGEYSNRRIGIYSGIFTKLISKDIYASTGTFGKLITAPDAVINGKTFSYDVATTGQVALKANQSEMDSAEAGINRNKITNDSQDVALNQAKITNDSQDVTINNNVIKLSGIFTGATKTEASTTNGNIKINGTETVVYTAPVVVPIQTGHAALNSNVGVTVPITALPNANYTVVPFLIGNSQGRAGDIWINSQTQSNFTVKCSGNSTTQFGWMLIPVTDVRFVQGAGTFNDTTGTTIAIGQDLGTSNYQVMITPTSNTQGKLGDYWSEQQTNTNFVVKCSGSSISTTFRWMIML